MGIVVSELVMYFQQHMNAQFHELMTHNSNCKMDVTAVFMTRLPQWVNHSFLVPFPLDATQFWALRLYFGGLAFKTSVPEMLLLQDFVMNIKLDPNDFLSLTAPHVSDPLSFCPISVSLSFISRFRLTVSSSPACPGRKETQRQKEQFHTRILVKVTPCLTEIFYTS